MLEAFKLIDYGARQLPVRKHTQDAGMDVFAPRGFMIMPGHMREVPLGFGVVLPDNYMAMTKVRGSSAKLGLWVADNPVDAGYTGEVHAIVWNISAEPITIKRGERFCQLVVMPCVCCAPEVIKPAAAPESERGNNRCGSTGGYHASESDR